MFSKLIRCQDSCMFIICICMSHIKKGTNRSKTFNHKDYIRINLPFLLFSHYSNLFREIGVKIYK